MHPSPTRAQVYQMDDPWYHIGEDRRSIEGCWFGECYAWRIEQLHKKSSTWVSLETKEPQYD